MKKNVYGILKVQDHLLLILLPLILAIISLGLGRMNIPISEVFKAIFQRMGLGSEVARNTEIVLWNMRLPRIILAMIVGAGLSSAGCTFQSLFTNPLASPDTLGVASGASFGAALGILFGFNLIGIQLCAMFFGVGAMVLSYLCSSKKNNSLSSIILAGIMIGSLFSALVSLVKYVADTESQLPAITYFLMGSLGSASYDNLKVGAPLIILSMAILYVLRWRLNILMLSDDEAEATGINLKLLKIVAILCVSSITASCVAMCGQVGWVGLLIPHMCRMRYGNNHLALIPASISYGASFMIIVDTLARTISASEIPISILTALIGAPFFIYLMRKSEGWSL